MTLYEQYLAEQAQQAAWEDYHATSYRRVELLRPRRDRFGRVVPRVRRDAHLFGVQAPWRFREDLTQSSKDRGS